MGAWIETLKPLTESYDTQVAPYVGAWIETTFTYNDEHLPHVAPYVGAWIETQHVTKEIGGVLSHPTWVRGLKLLFSFFDRVELSRTLRGCVD